MVLWRGAHAFGGFWPTAGDATAIPPIWTRGVLFDVPRYRGVDSLGRSEPISADELKAIAKGNSVELGQGDVALVRTGYLSHWPDTAAQKRTEAQGPICRRPDGWPSPGSLHADRTLRRSKSNPRPHRIVERPATPSPFTRCF